MVLLLILLQAIIFQFFGQIAKYLQEKGVSGLGVLYYSRYVIYPSAFALFYFWDQESVAYLFSQWHILGVFIGFLISSSLFQYLYFVSRHMVRSLSFVSAVLNAIGLPLLLFAGVLINHDIPTIYEIIGIIALAVAVFLKPSSEKKYDQISQFRYAIPVIIGISVFYLILQVIKDPLYREFMLHMPDIWFSVSLYLFCSALILNILFFFKKVSEGDVLIGQSPSLKKFAYAIPALLFIGSFPEAYSFANAPVYTIVAISMINFMMSLISDVYNKRVRFNSQTVVFALLVMSGVGLNIFGRFH